MFTNQQSNKLSAGEKFKSLQSSNILVNEELPPIYNLKWENKVQRKPALTGDQP